MEWLTPEREAGYTVDSAQKDRQQFMFTFTYSQFRITN